MKMRFTDEQIIGVLREAEVGATSIKALCRKHNITEQTFFRWRNKLGGLDVPDARRSWNPRTRGSSAWWPSRCW